MVQLQIENGNLQNKLSVLQVVNQNMKTQLIQAQKQIKLLQPEQASGAAQHNLCATLKKGARISELLDQPDGGVPLYSACTLIPRGKNALADVPDSADATS